MLGAENSISQCLPPSSAHTCFLLSLPQRSVSFGGGRVDRDVRFNAEHSISHS